MSAEAVVYRFPTGTEFRMIAALPNVGDMLQKDGQEWIVADVTEDEHGHKAVWLKPYEALVERVT